MAGLRLVSFGENRLIGSGLAAKDALSRAARLFEGNAAHGRFRFVLNLFFAFRSTAPPGKCKALLDHLLELSIVSGLSGVRFTEFESAIVQSLLNLFEHLRNRDGNSLLRDEGFPFFAGAIAPREND